MTKNCLDVLFQQYYECFVLFAESYVGDVTMAEDMVQDVFLTLLSRPDFSKVEYTLSLIHIFLSTWRIRRCLPRFS